VSKFSSAFFDPKNLESSTGLLRELVLISSGTANSAGVNAVQRRVKQELDALGFTTTLTANPDPSFKSGELLTGILPGHTSRTVTLVTHADTVFEKDSGFDGFNLSVDKSRAVGPGVIDDKGGIVIALSGLRYLLSTGQPLCTIRFVCSPSEETGSPGFYEIFQDYSKDSSLILGFEPSLEDGSIIESRRGNLWYHFKIQGKETHAGRDHRGGINAGHELAIKLDKLQRLTSYPKEETVSIAWVRGGSDKFNIVCGDAEGKIDARFSDDQSRVSMKKKIETILKKSFVQSAATKKKTSTTFQIANNCPAFAKTKESTIFLEKYRDFVLKLEGKKVKSQRGGGAADSNLMSRASLPVVDGLGAVGTGIHSKQETIVLSSLETRAHALAALLTFAGEQFAKRK